MADAEDLDQEDGSEDSVAAPISSGRSRIVTILIWVVAGLIALALMFVISVMVAKYYKNADFQETESITIAPPSAPPAIFNVLRVFSAAGIPFKQSACRKRSTRRPCVAPARSASSTTPQRSLRSAAAR